MIENQDGAKIQLDNEQTKLFRNPMEKTCELSTYNGYRTFYLEPGDGYNIGSFFAFPKDNTYVDYEEKSFKEMIVRQNINEDKEYSTQNEFMFETLPQFQKLIDDIRETNGVCFMPLLPTEKESGRDYENLSEKAMEDTGKYYQLHKQIANAFDMSRLQISRLTKKDVPEKWFLYGKDKSCTGLFRLWSLCPEKTSAICCNNSIDKIVLPIMAHKSENMKYPHGFENYKEITGIDGNNPEMLAQYRDTDVLYISYTYDLDKQKEEESKRTQLRRLKFPNINIERYNAVKIVDFSYFYQFRSEIYKESLLGKILKKIGRRREEPRQLSSGINIEDNTEPKVRPGEITEAQKEKYMDDYANIINNTPSRKVAKQRLAQAIGNRER